MKSKEGAKDPVCEYKLSVSEGRNGRSASYSDPGRNLNPTFYRLLIWTLIQSNQLPNNIWHNFTL